MERETESRYALEKVMFAEPTEAIGAPKAEVTAEVTKVAEAPKVEEVAAAALATAAFTAATLHTVASAQKLDMRNPQSPPSGLTTACLDSNESPATEEPFGLLRRETIFQDVVHGGLFLTRTMRAIFSSHVSVSKAKAQTQALAANKVARRWVKRT
jgi:hypothetical protein